MKEKIMIVDDHEDIREVVHVLLTNEGYQIIEAKDGKEALELLDDEIDLIILDVMMPKLDGFSACKQIKKIKKIPIIMLSARQEEYDKLFGFELGVDDYVVKPFSPKELMARVKVVIDRSRKHENEILKLHHHKLSVS